MKSSSIRFVILLFSIAALAAGCGATDAAPGECKVDQDCQSGEVCDPVSAQCLPPSTSVPSLEVLPPGLNTQGWVMQELLRPPVDADGRIRVQLVRGASVEGSVYASHDPTRTVQAQVIAWRDSLLQGRPKVQFEATSGGQRDASQKERFLLWVNSGHTYTFYVAPLAPLDALYPPLVVSGVKVTADMKRDFVLDGNDRAVLVKGKVLDYNLSVLKATNLYDEKGQRLAEEASVRVRAIEAGSGLKRSTLGTSDPKTGAFSFRVPAGVATYTLKVESLSGHMPVPTLECTGLVLGLASPKPGEQPVQEVSSIRLPSFNLPKPFSVSVLGSDGSAVKGATVTFKTAVSVVVTDKMFEGCSASYSRTGYTDATGKVTLLLLPGSGTANQEYTVAVESPGNSPHANQYIAKLEVGAGGGTLAPIKLAGRYKLDGKVARADTGAAVAGVILEAQAVVPGSTATVPVTDAETTTDRNGAYTLYVDPGIYNFTVRPPTDSGLPTFGMTAKVEGDVHGKVFQVPTPKVLPGKVLDPAGKPIPSAKVNVYELVPEVEKPLTRRATLRATSLTNTSGSFGLILPDGVK